MNAGGPSLRDENLTCTCDIRSNSLIPTPFELFPALDIHILHSPASRNWGSVLRNNKPRVTTHRNSQTLQTGIVPIFGLVYALEYPRGPLMVFVNVYIKLNIITLVVEFDSQCACQMEPPAAWLRRGTAYRRKPHDGE